MQLPIPEKYINKRAYEHGDMTFYGARHRGIDFRTPILTPVYATQDGVVYYEKSPIIGHAAYLYANDGTLHRYLHLHQPPKTGNVKVGQQIGLTGNTGLSTGPHLHYDIYKSHNFNVYNFDGFINPDKYMEEVRLYKKDGDKHVWAVINGLRYWVPTHVSLDGWTIRNKDVQEIPYSGKMVLFLPTDEPK